MRQGVILSFYSCHCFPTLSPLLASPALPFASLLNRVPPGQGVLGWDVHTHLVALSTAPELKKQLCPIMNQPNLLFPLNPSMPAQPCCRLHDAERQSCHVSNRVFFSPGQATINTAPLRWQHQLAHSWDSLWDAMVDQGSTPS